MYPDKVHSKKKVLHPTPGVEDPPAKKLKPDKAKGGKFDRPKGDQLPTPGLLIWRGSSLAPIPDIHFTHSVWKKRKKLCRFFPFQGLSCKIGKDCQNIHQSNTSTMDAAKQVELKAFVTKTDGVEWVPGKMPTEG
jgi:hypothetical protein